MDREKQLEKRVATLRKRHLDTEKTIVDKAKANGNLVADLESKVSSNSLDGHSDDKIQCRSLDQLSLGWQKRRPRKLTCLKRWLLSTGPFFQVSAQKIEIKRLEEMIGPQFSLFSAIEKLDKNVGVKEIKLMKKKELLAFRSALMKKRTEMVDRRESAVDAQFRRLAFNRYF